MIDPTETDIVYVPVFFCRKLSEMWGKNEYQCSWIPGSGKRIGGCERSSHVVWKAIIQWVIRELIYDCDKYVDTSRLIVSKRMLDVAEVKYYQYERTGRKIEIGL